MLFNSYTFIFLFLPVMLSGYFLLARRGLILESKLWLIGGNLFFYAYWNLRYLPLLLLSVMVNFFVGSVLADLGDGLKNQKIVNSRHVVCGDVSPGYLFLFGILFNVSLLGYFKYTDFFIENFNWIFGSNISMPHIILPIGISFFTFTQIAFLIDAYTGKGKRYNFLHYTLFVTYFPAIMSGPIMHHAEMIPQFKGASNYELRWNNVALGLFLFSVGLFKKAVIADTFAMWANTGFDVATTLNFFEAWATSLSYTIQLYFDFSGYTDMAIGMSVMFNIKLPTNFNSPYKARDIQDFWKRWHITLSNFLRDYIYIPMGGNKVSKLHNYLNIFAVFLIGGIWHGASWMFVIWGAMHGAAIICHRVWKNCGLRMQGWMGWLITFNFVNIAWVFFRAENVEVVKKVLGGMIGAGGVVLPERAAVRLVFLKQFGVAFGERFLDNLVDMRGQHLLLIGGIIGFLVWSKNSSEWGQRLKPTFHYQLITGFMLSLGIFSLSKISKFLYSQF